MGAYIQENEPNWAKILSELYDSEQADLPIDDMSEFVRDGLGVGLNDDAIHTSLSYLESAGLLDQGGGNRLRLTRKGFEVAQQRELAKQQARRERQQNQTNTALGYLTLGLILINAIGIAQQAAVSGLGTSFSVSWSLLNFPNIWTAVGFLVVAGMYVLVHRAGLLRSGV